MFVSNFGVGSLEQSVKLGWLVILISLAIPFSKRHFFQTKNQKAVLFQCFHCLSCFSAAVAKENLLKTPAIVLLANFQIFKFCCDIQGSHLIGCLWVSLIIDQSECLICYFLCTELTLFCTELTLFHTELPENCIYPNQSELSNFSMYIIKVQSMNICFINFTFHARIKSYFPDYQQDMLRMRCFNKFRLKLLIEKLRESFL